LGDCWELEAQAQAQPVQTMFGALALCPNPDPFYQNVQEWLEFLQALSKSIIGPMGVFADPLGPRALLSTVVNCQWANASSRYHIAGCYHDHVVCAWSSLTRLDFCYANSYVDYCLQTPRNNQSSKDSPNKHLINKSIHWHPWLYVPIQQIPQWFSQLTAVIMRMLIATKLPIFVIHGM